MTIPARMAMIPTTRRISRRVNPHTNLLFKFRVWVRAWVVGFLDRSDMKE
jgi:hypothetical protein